MARLTNNYTYVDSAATGTLASSAITCDSTRVLKVNDEVVKLSIKNFDDEELKRKITQILLEDPDSDVKKMAEDYLIQCLYEATEDPENNPILKRFFSNNKEEIDRLTSDIWEAKNEILQLKTELQALKDKLRINSDGYNYNWNEDQGVAWKNDVQGQFQYLESKLISITEKLGKAGIDINYWEN
jgi:predicted RNase H-like nuclease (RuvC/YqgF family)